MTRIYRIVNREGGKVCDRGTKRECIDLLEKHVTEPPTFPHWDNGPYHVLRIETTHVRRFKPRAVPTKGSAK